MPASRCPRSRRGHADGGNVVQRHPRGFAASRMRRRHRLQAVFLAERGSVAQARQLAPQLAGIVDDARLSSSCRQRRPRREVLRHCSHSSSEPIQHADLRRYSRRGIGLAGIARRQILLAVRCSVKDDRMPRLLASPLFHVAVIVGVAAASRCPGLGSTSLWDIDEGLNAEAAREMLESATGSCPQFNFKPRTAKPALLYWLQAISLPAPSASTNLPPACPSAMAMCVAALLTYRAGPADVLRRDRFARRR